MTGNGRVSNRICRRGPDRDDDRRIISGIIHMLQSGARWRDCPREYGPYTTVYNRFNRWAKRGRWCAIFEALAKPGKDAVALSLDSTSIKAHRCASGRKGGSTIKPSAALTDAASEIRVRRDMFNPFLRLISSYS